MIKAGVIGLPIDHSKSPIIHTYWIEKYALKGTYEAFKVYPEHLEKKIETFINEGYAGFNVTLPHKQSIIEYCDTLDEAAQKIGAVNTVTIKGTKLHGTNTDAFGFIQNIKKAHPNFDFTRGPAVVLGAGGAARAVVYALLKEGAPEIILTNRTREKAESFKGKINIIPWEERESALEGAGLLVNTTSLGMEGQPALEFDLKTAPKGMAVCDIVYAPLMTQLLTDAQAEGLPIITGIGMLLQQARPAFETWFGVMPRVDEGLTKKVLEE